MTPHAMTSIPDPDPIFQRIPDLIRQHARARPARAALVQGATTLSYAELDALMDRVAASLQRDGLHAGDVIAICAYATPLYAAVFLGALRAGMTVTVTVDTLRERGLPRSVKNLVDAGWLPQFLEPKSAHAGAEK